MQNAITTSFMMSLMTPILRSVLRSTRAGLALSLALGLTLTGAHALAAKEIKYVPSPSSFDQLPPATKGGTLIIALNNNPKVINPVISDDANSSYLEPFIWATLFQEDTETLKPIPYLAESYTVSADKKLYTFTLNPNAKWEDGTPVTAEDVKFSFETMMNPKTDSASMRAYLQGVSLHEVKGNSVTFRVEVPKFDTLRSLYLLRTIQKKQFANEPDFNKARGILQPIGNGPYKFVALKRDQQVELERKKDWWGYSIPNLKHRWNADRIILKIVPDSNLEYERFVKGDLDMMAFAGPSYEVFARKVRGTDKARFADKPGQGKLWTLVEENKAPRGYTYVGWNLRKPIFSSKKTRQALAHLADTKEIAEKVYFGFAYQSTSPFGSLTMNSAPDLRQPGKMIGLDVKKAVALLKEDGWADTDKDNILDKTINGQKVPFRFEVKYNSNNPARGKIAQILKENFKKAGIDLSIRSMEWNAYLSDIDNRQFDAIIMGWTATPYPNPRQTWHTESEKNKGSNFGSYSNKKVDELIDIANVEFDLSKRAKVLQEINRILYDEQPYMWLVEPKAMVAGFSPKVKSKVWSMAYDVDPPIDIYSYE